MESNWSPNARFSGFGVQLASKSDGVKSFAFSKVDFAESATLQNYGSSTAPLFFYVFDVLILASRDVRAEALETRRELLRTGVLSTLREPIRYSRDLNASLPDLIRSVREQGFEGLVAKS